MRQVGCLVIVRSLHGIRLTGEPVPLAARLPHITYRPPSEGLRGAGELKIRVPVVRFGPWPPSLASAFTDYLGPSCLSRGVGLERLDVLSSGR
jgi:hypothetical protein